MDSDHSEKFLRTLSEYTEEILLLGFSTIEEESVKNFSKLQEQAQMLGLNTIAQNLSLLTRLMDNYTSKPDLTNANHIVQALARLEFLCSYLMTMPTTHEAIQSYLTQENQQNLRQETRKNMEQ